MLRVRVEFVPYGREQWRSEIAQLEIINLGTGNPERGNYKLVLRDETGIARVGCLENYKRERGATALIYESLGALGFAHE